MKISIFIFIGFVVILSLFSITTYINYRLSQQVDENTAYLTASAQIVREGNRFQRNILNMTSGLNGYLFTSEDYFIQTYDSAVIENNQILNDLTARMPNDSRQLALLNEIRKVSKIWMDDYANPLIKTKKAAQLNDSLKISFGTVYQQVRQSRTEDQLTRNINSLVKSFINYEYNLRDVRKQLLTNSIERTRAISIVLTSLSVIMGFIIAIFLAQSISKRIMKMVDMSNYIASGNYDVYIEDKGKDELSGLARSLNHMAGVLAENIALLKRKNLELDQFAHIVSHDMKAPLRGIDNVVTWIEEDHWNDLPGKVKEYINVIKGRVVRGENLINGILSYSRAGRTAIANEEVDVRQLLIDIWEGFSISGRMNISLPAILPVIYTERLPLMQVFSNLISNAIKHNDKIPGQITIGFEEEKDRYLFSVEDNGPGIAPQYHEKIFKIFQTLNENSFENTGVGLAIIKKILDDRNQTISINSEPGEGARFTFSWPKQ